LVGDGGFGNVTGTVECSQNKIVAKKQPELLLSRSPLESSFGFPHFLAAIKIEIRKVCCLYFPISLFCIETVLEF